MSHHHFAHDRLADRAQQVLHLGGCLPGEEVVGAPGAAVESRELRGVGLAAEVAICRRRRVDGALELERSDDALGRKIEDRRRRELASTKYGGKFAQRGFGRVCAG